VKNPKLEQLSQKIAAISAASPVEISSTSSSATSQNASSLRFHQTMTNTLGSAFRSGCANSLLSYSLGLIPILFSLADHPDLDVSREAKQSLSYLVQSTIPPLYVSSLVNVFLDLLKKESWHTRLTTLPFLQVLLYRNIFLIQPEEERVLISRLVTLLSDPQLEVRQLAATTFSGVLEFLGEADCAQLQKTFEKMANTPIPKPSKSSGSFLGSTSTNDQLTRHAGVLGLSAIVLSHPYDLPPFLPALLVKLAGHVSDPNPIKSTVKSTFLEFWRTHQDQWDQMFKERFEENQLTLLTELLVSPSYFA